MCLHGFNTVWKPKFNYISSAVHVNIILTEYFSSAGCWQLLKYIKFCYKAITVVNHENGVGSIGGVVSNIKTSWMIKLGYLLSHIDEGYSLFPPLGSLLDKWGMGACMSYGSYLGTSPCWGRNSSQDDNPSQDVPVQRPSRFVCVVLLLSLSWSVLCPVFSFRLIA